MRQAKLDEYTGRKSLVCERCGRNFKSDKGLNVHITKSHAGDEMPPRYVGEGIEEVKTEGSFVDLRIRIKRSLWNGIKKTASSEKIKPDDVIIASLVNLTVYGAKIEQEPTYIS